MTSEAMQGARAMLRAETAARHDRVDALFSRFDLGKAQDYARFLQAQAGAHLPVEQALDAAGAEALSIDWAARRRGAELVADLADLGASVPSPLAAPAFDGPAAMLGAIYVLEGSRLGGALLRRSVDEKWPTRFLAGGQSSAWRQLLAILDDRLTSAPDHAAAAAAACAVFDLFERSARDILKV